MIFATQPKLLQKSTCNTKKQNNYTTLAANPNSYAKHKNKRKSKLSVKRI
jgi:hypothetical protein